MGTFLTSRIVTCELERSKPLLDGEGYPVASNCMTGAGLPQPCMGWGQDEFAELPAQGSHSSSFSCFSGRATRPVWTRPMLESSPCFCDSHITCHCTLAPPHFICAIKIPFPRLIPVSLHLAGDPVPGQGGPLLLSGYAACPGSTLRQLAPHAQN